MTGAPSQASDRLSALRCDYPTLALDVWAHRMAASDIVDDVAVGVQSPDVVARIVGGWDPMVLPRTSLEVAHAVRARGPLGAALPRRSRADA